MSLGLDDDAVVEHYRESRGVTPIRLLWWLRFCSRLTWMLFVLPFCLALMMVIALVDVLEMVRHGVIDEWRTD